MPSIYHGSATGGLTALEPRPTRVLEQTPAVFGTADRDLALTFTAPWRDEDFEQGYINHKPYMREQYPGAFDKIYGGKSGFLYHLDPKGFKKDPRLMREERVKTSPAKVINTEAIHDLLAALKQTRFDLQPYKKAAAAGIPDRSEFGDLSKLPVGQLLNYVVQHHKADRAGPHYDVRLGNEDTGLFSWASRKGVPQKGEKRLAVQQPLHDASYGDFAGTIPEGYGKGTVSLHDSGKALVTKVEPNKIHFTVAHRRYPERYVLFKPTGGIGQKETNWLLMNTTPVDPLKYPKPKYKSVPADKVKPLLDNLQPGSSVQAKIDGAHTLTQVLKDKIELLSYRQSKVHGGPITHTERVFRTIPNVNVPKEYQGSVMSGELYGTQKGQALDPQALGGLLNSSIAKSIPAQDQLGMQFKNQLFDLRRLGKKDVTTDTPYETRMGHLRSILQSISGPDASKVQDVYHLPEEARTPETANKLYQDIAGGLHPGTSEGIVVHPPTGTPMKSKMFDEHDVHIRGVFPGKGKYTDRGVGGFVYSHDPKGPIVGEVGTGFSDQLREDMFKDPNAYTGRVARVRTTRKLPSGALFQPSLLALHEDLPMAEVKPL